MKIDSSDIINESYGIEGSYKDFYQKIGKLLDEMAWYSKLTHKEMKLEHKMWITCDLSVYMGVRHKSYFSQTSEQDEQTKIEIFQLCKPYRNMIVTLLRSKNNYYASIFRQN